MKFLIIILCLYGLAQIPAVKVHVDAGLGKAKAFVDGLLSTPPTEDRLMKQYTPRTPAGATAQRTAPSQPAVSSASVIPDVSNELKDKRPFGGTRDGSY